MTSDDNLEVIGFDELPKPSPAAIHAMELVERLLGDPIEEERVSRLLGDIERAGTAYRAGWAARANDLPDIAEEAFRRAALEGHPEAAYELAHLLLTSQASVTTDPGQSDQEIVALWSGIATDLPNEKLQEAGRWLWVAVQAGVVGPGDIHEDLLRLSSQVTLGERRRRADADAAVDNKASNTHQVSVETITSGLRRILRNGVRPAQLRHCRELLDLRCVRERAGGSDEPDRLAFGLEAVLRAAIDALGDTPQGRAIELLMGATVDTRGLLLRDRRREAAASLHVAVSTFRQNFEDEIVEDVAAEILRLELVAAPAP